MSLLSVMWIVTPIRSFLISWLLAEQRWHILLGNIQKTTCMVLLALWLRSPSSILALTTAEEWIAHANSVSRNIHIARKCEKRKPVETAQSAELTTKTTPCFTVLFTHLAYSAWMPWSKFLTWPLLSGNLSAMQSKITLTSLEVYTSDQSMLIKSWTGWKFILLTFP